MPGVSIKLNHKAYALLIEICSSNSLRTPLEEAKIPEDDQQHHLRITTRHVCEMTQLIRQALKIIKNKTANQQTSGLWTITEKNLKQCLKYLH